jgi:hypothetical protein
MLCSLGLMRTQFQSTHGRPACMLCCSTQLCCIVCSVHTGYTKASAPGSWDVNYIAYNSVQVRAGQGLN